MAQIKRPPTKESAIVDWNMKYDDAENMKRRKRLRDDDPYKCDEKSYLPQKKRNYGLYQSTAKNRRQNSDDQDDDALIRETQAALKSLSGSWPDDRTSIYKSNETDENPSFQNLFDEKCNHRVKMSPTTSTVSTHPYANYCSENMPSAEALRDGFPFREYNGKFKPTVQKVMQQQTKYRSMDATRNVYQSHDFNELVDDSSNEQTTQIEMSNGMLKEEPSYNQNGLRKLNESVYGGGGMYATHRMMPAFAQNSAFRPPADTKRMPPVASGYQPQSAIDPANYMNYAPTPDLAICNTADKEKYAKVTDAVKDDETASAKSLDSPDSKQYTTLQPAGVDSKAASVMQDIAREGVLSVAAVSSTSSPGLSGSSNTQAIVDKSPPYDRAVPPFSPTSSSAKGT